LNAAEFGKPVGKLSSKSCFVTSQWLLPSKPCIY
jgi:hypothetical protein